MQSILKTIAKQANLDRILFTPALKKIYFDMAVASGGATQFKHTENARSGLSYAADKAGDKKHVLLFCAAHELLQAYDSLLQLSANMSNIVVLALREGTPDHLSEHASFLQFREIGWLQFLTHTAQEVYDHLALAYNLFEEKELKLPVLIFHSTMTHDEFTPREEMNLGNPLTGLQSARAGKKMDFDAALAAMRAKKEKPSLRGNYEKALPMLREIYSAMNYALPDRGLPFAGNAGKDTCIVSLIPAAEEDASNDLIRPLCYRPWTIDTWAASLQGKTRVAVVEPQSGLGASVPPFFGELCATLGSSAPSRLISVTSPPNMTMLHPRQLDNIHSWLNEKEEQRFYAL